VPREGSGPKPTVVSGPSLPLLAEQDWREMVLRLAHEIRNPLATIKSGTQLIQRLTRPEGDVAECLKGMLANVSRIDQTLQDLQRFVRLDAGQPAVIELGPIVEDAVAQRQPTALRAGVALQIAQGPRANVQVDPQNLGMALDELFSNALRVTPPGAAVMVSWVADKQLVLIHVDDEGPGVSQELAGRIVRPFFSTASQGTGLGLNIADKACRLAGGSMAWRNLAGRGCRFTLSLPVA
jgi:signal transduction histidine kinase